jgi:hypothetical protein
MLKTNTNGKVEYLCKVIHHPHPTSQYIFILQSTHYCHQPKTPIGAFRALKFVKNEVELRKL